MKTTYPMNKSFILIGIVCVAAFLRLIFLGSIAPSLTWDETAWGYNAYSLGYDGKDEFGKVPITYLESFGDFKPPLYAYLDVLPVKIFGLNEFATRLPSALFGILTVFLTYLFVKEVFGKQHDNLALLSSFILAISPWHIMLSRAAFEANVASSFVLLGVILFLKGRTGSKYFILFSILSFVASMYTFNSSRIVSPILFALLAVIYHKTLLKNWKMTAISGLIGMALFLPLFLFLNTPQAKLRFNEVNIFSDINVINRTNQEIANDNNSAFSKVIHNRRFAYSVEFLRHYIDNLTPQFLFIRGDGNPKFSTQDNGQLYIWEIPFLVAGFLLLVRKREKRWWILPIMLLVGILPAGFARETPHALRIENSIPVLQIVTAIGLLAFIRAVPKKLWKATVGFVTFIVIANFVYFAHNYFVNSPREFSGEWQHGYKESISYVNSVKGNYSSIYVTEALGRPYVYYLFYLGYSPSLFRENADVYREALGFVHVRSFSNIHFTTTIAKLNEKNALYISTPSEKPEKANVLKEFKLLNGQTSLVAYTL